MSAPCPHCGLADGFHAQTNGIPDCGHFTVPADWEFVGTKTPAESEYIERWYAETSDGRAGICHVIRSKPVQP